MSDAKSPPELSMDEILATIRRIISEDEHTGAPSAGRGVKTADVQDGDSDDVLELTEAINEDGSTRHLAPIGGAGRRAALILEPPPVAAPPAPEPEPPPQLKTVPNPPPAPEGSVTAPREPHLSPDIVLGAGDRTLEEIVRDVLRPLLQTWLDQNLPPLVERVVQAEIARVGRAAGAG